MKSEQILGERRGEMPFSTFGGGMEFVELARRRWISSRFVWCGGEIPLVLLELREAKALYGVLNLPFFSKVGKLIN